MRRLLAGGTQETGLIAVVLLLGLLLTFGAAPVRLATGEVVNNFLRLDNLIPNVATPMSWIAIMALGVTVVIVAGGIDISIGSIFGLAALGTAAVLQRLDEHASAALVWPLAASIALGIGAACGLVNGLLVVGLRMHPFIVTLGTLTIFRGLALVSVAEKSLPSGARTLPLAMTSAGVAWPLQIARGDLPPLRIEPVPTLIMLVCGVVTAVLLSRTVLGRQLYAIGGNEEAARFSGIPVGRAKLVAYVLSGLAAGIAGFISTGYFGSANTATGEGYELHVIAAAVVGGASLSGGRGTALGALLGALVIKLIENGIFILKQINFGLFVLPLSKEYSKIIIGIAILLAVATDRFSEYIRTRAARGRPSGPPRP